MPAQVITVANQKGGSGKTTLVMQLAGTMARRGAHVLVVDADPQGTATRWATSAPDAAPFPASVVGLSAAGGHVHREVEIFMNDYAVILIDCPPAVESPVPQSALLIADLALVPVMPSPLDLWAAIGIRTLIERMQDINESLRARLVINGLEPRTSLANQTSEILGQFGIPVLEAALHHRTPYRASAIWGGTVHNLGRRAAAAVREVDALTDEVMAILHKESRDGDTGHESGT